MKRISHYSFRQYDNKVFAVTEHYAPGRSYTFGVVWSRERCLVIDTGLGLFGDVRKYIEGLTGFEKAIFTVSTCGSPEAVGAAGLFDESFVNGADLEMASRNMNVSERIAALKRYVCNEEIIAEAEGDNIVDNSRVEIFDYRDPRFLRSPDSIDHIHLGGVHVEGEPLPGYTPGSIVLSVHGDDTINTMFCGRSLSPRVNDLRNLDRAGFETYCSSLQTLIGRAEQYTRFPVKKDSEMYFFSADSQGEAFFIDVPKKILIGAGEILRGETACDMPASCDGRALKIHFAGSAQIIYDPELV